MGHGRDSLIVRLIVVVFLILRAADTWGRQPRAPTPKNNPKGKTVPVEDRGPTALVEAKVWKGHTGRVLTVAMTSDGKWVYSGGIDKTLRVWPAGAGQPRQIHGFGKPFQHLRQIEFVPVSSKARSQAQPAAILSGEELGLIDLRTGRGGKLSDAIATVSISPDGQTLVGSFHPDQCLLLWNAQTGGKRARVQLQSTAHAMAVSPDSSLVIVDTDQEALQSYSLKSGRAEVRYKGQPGAIKVIAFLPDGQHFVSAGHATDVWLWNTASGEVAHKLPGHPRGVNDLALSPDGARLYAACEDGSVRVWDMAATRKITERAVHDGAVLAISLDANERWLATAGSDETVRLLELSAP
jgi:WD40 repeat protein